MIEPIEMLAAKKQAEDATPQPCAGCGHDRHAHIQDRGKMMFTCYAEDCICEDYRPPTTEPAESSEKNLVAKIHLSDEDAALFEEFRNACFKPTAPPAETEDAKAWAKAFHDLYEELAPQFGYETRADTKVFDPESQNGRLMTAVVGQLLEQYATKQIERQTPAIIEGVFADLENELVDSYYDAIEIGLVHQIIDRVKARQSKGEK